MDMKGQSEVWIVGIVFILFLLALVGFGLLTAAIPAGNVGIVNTFGQVQDYALQPGFQFKAPWTGIISMSIQTEKYTSTATAASFDLQDVKTDVVVNYRLEGTQAVRVYKDIGTDYSDKIIVGAVQESVKASTAKFTATDLINKRPEVKAEIEKSLSEKLKTFGIAVDMVSITEFKFSDKFTEAIEAKQVADQKWQEAQNKLKQIEVEAKQAAALAEGEANAVKLNADAKAYATLAEATAEAKAIQLKGEQLKQNSQLVSYVAVEKWNGVLPTQMLGSSPVPFIDISKTGGQ